MIRVYHGPRVEFNSRTCVAGGLTGRVGSKTPGQWACDSEARWLPSHHVDLPVPQCACSTVTYNLEAAAQGLSSNPRPMWHWHSGWAMPVRAAIEVPVDRPRSSCTASRRNQCLVLVGNDMIGLDTVDRQFEPYRWRTCGVTRDGLATVTGAPAAPPPRRPTAAIRGPAGSGRPQARTVASHSG